MIRVPPQLSATTLSPALTALEEQYLEPDLIVSLEEVEFAYPIGAVLLLSAIKHANSWRQFWGVPPIVVVPPAAPQSRGYLEHMRILGALQNGDDRDAASALARPGRYVALTAITRDALPANRADFYRALTERSEGLARLLASPTEAVELGTYQFLVYCFREALRNTFEHSGARTAYVVGQAWDGGRAEIAVCDLGCGLRESLSRTHTVESAEEAIRLATRPGLSGAPPGVADEWENTGFGLYVMSELGRQLGRFVLVSGQRLFLASEGWETLSTCALTRGTICGIAGTGRGIYVENLVEQIVRRGEEQAAGGTAVTRRASGTLRPIW